MNSPEQEWQEVDEKVILVQILMELKQIRAALQPVEQDTEQRWSCIRCPWEGTDRHGHLSAHNATVGMIDEVFEPL